MSGFEPEVSEIDYLKRRLREEKVKSANAERARREAEARCHAAERERVSSQLSEIILGVLMHPSGLLTLNVFQFHPTLSGVDSTMAKSSKCVAQST
jgi:hypothetical protein